MSANGSRRRTYGTGSITEKNGNPNYPPIRQS
jgi:hypothetical protein